MFYRALTSVLSFAGCPGVLKALLVSIGGHVVQAEECKPPECHPAAVLWTVLLRYSVRPQTELLREEAALGKPVIRRD